MEKFAYVFLAGAALFFVSMLAFGGPGDFSSDGVYTPSISLGSGDAIYSTNSVILGKDAEQSVRAIKFGSFSVGYSPTEKTVEEIEELTIKNGLLVTQEGALSFSGKQVNVAYLSFDVAQTNAYGDLEVYLNGKKIEADVSTAGPYRMMIEDLEEDNVITFKAQSSGARFWAPTTYILRNVLLTVESRENQEKLASFKILESEYEFWDVGRVRFAVSNAMRESDMIVELNGKRIYAGKPIVRATSYEESFSKTETSIKPGENTLVFKTDGEGVYDLKNVELLIFFYAYGEASSHFTDFTLSEAQVNSVRAGDDLMLSFDIDEVLNSNIRVFMNDMEQDFKLVAGSNAVSIDANDLKAGQNTMKISTYGHYELGDVKLSIR